MTALPSNPLAAVIVIAIIVLFGSGAGGAVIAIRKDNRQAEREEVDLTQLIKSVAAETIQELSQRVEKLQAELDQVRRQSVRDIEEERRRSDQEIKDVSWKLNKRIAQLENAIRRMPGGVVPPWLDDTPPGGLGN